MNLIIISSLIALAAAAQLPSPSYLPQSPGPQPGYGSGSIGNGFGSGHNGNAPQSQRGQSGYGGGGPNGNGFSSGHGGNGFGNGGGFGGNGGNGVGGDAGNTRPQQEQEKKAAILKQDQDIGDNGEYHFGYETENGITAEEAGDGNQSQGGFSYKGDDGTTYTVQYSAGEGGFRPQGEHLPVAPPTPEAILEALRKNAEDEAAGIFDDGLYKPDVHGGPGVNGAGSGNGNGSPSGHNGFGGQQNGGHNGFGTQNGGQNGYGGQGNQNGFNPNSGYTY